MSSFSQGSSTGPAGKQPPVTQNQVNRPQFVDNDESIDYSSYFRTTQWWSDRDSMIEWARSEGRKHSMILTIFRSWASSEDRFGMVYLTCQKYGNGKKRKKKVVDDEDCRIIKTRNSSSKKIGCPFVLHGFEAMRNIWRLEVACGIHNHALHKDLEGHASPQQLPSKHIISVEQMPVATKKTQQIRSLETGDTSWTQKLFITLTRGKYKFNWRFSHTRKLKDIAFAHPESLNLWKKFPYILFMDSNTFKTNKYNMPLLEIVGMTCTNMTFHMGFVFMIIEDEDTYDWLFGQWCAKYQPEVIVTKGEHGLLEAIPKTFPNAHHMLCTTHVLCDIAENACRKLLSAVRQREFVQESKILFKSESRELFETRRRDMLVRWESWGLMEYLNQKWLCHQDKLLLFLTDQHFHLGNRTTKRVESVHTTLIQNVGTCDGQFDLCFEIIERMLDDHFNQVRESLEQSYFKIQSEIRELLIFSLLLERMSHKGLRLLYKTFKEVTEGKFSNECKNCYVRTSFGLPCAHEVARIMYEERHGFFEKDVHVFWLQVQRCGRRLDDDDTSVEENTRKVMSDDQRQTSIDCDDPKTQQPEQSLPISVGGYDFGQENFVSFMVPYVLHVGNCGFRALAVLLGRPENNWVMIRASMLKETTTYPERYTPLLRGMTMANFRSGLNWFRKGVPAPETYRMDMPICGALFATIFQCTLVYLDWFAAHTSLPLVRQPPAPGSPPPNTIVILCQDRFK